MCVICVKPVGVKLPNEEVLKKCFFANPDGAGYMFIENEQVHIKKGYMTFDTFYTEITNDYKRINGDKKAIVMHFRIGTSGSKTAGLTHPYPISSELSKLKETDCYANIGVAHNGILSITSGYSYKNLDKEDKNDTMAFITDYISLFIKTDDDLKDEDKLSIIKRLIGGTNRLAFLTTKEVRLIGDFEKDDATGCIFSNMYWKYASLPDKHKKETNNNVVNFTKKINLKKHYDTFYNEKTGRYDFIEKDCPFSHEGKSEYCNELICSNYSRCKHCTMLLRKRRKALKALRKKAKRNKNKEMIKLIEMELNKRG